MSEARQMRTRPSSRFSSSYHFALASKHRSTGKRENEKTRKRENGKSRRLGLNAVKPNKFDDRWVSCLNPTYFSHTPLQVFEPIQRHFQVFVHDVDRIIFAFPPSVGIEPGGWGRTILESNPAPGVNVVKGHLGASHMVY